MTEKKKNLDSYIPFQLPSPEKYRIGIVVSEWNDHITDSLLEGARAALQDNGILKENIIVKHVPGSFELPTGAAHLIQQTPLDGVICIGCIIQGETRHFEFIAHATAEGIMQLNLSQKVPVIFSVLTCDTMQQAEDRSGGKMGNKGVEGAISCLKMIALDHSL
ncbi:MAG: 6,7-dimethyl-8-ribityllumazine synthase [Bacteroidales bacterium]|nr:6,7-dimethyl-8-ribityllumazine synthase [Bacteroidales bacterium]